MDIKLILYTIPNSLFNFRVIKVKMRELPLWTKFIFLLQLRSPFVALKVKTELRNDRKANYSLSSPHYAGLSGCVYISSIQPSIFSFKEKENHVFFFMNTITVSSDCSSERQCFHFPNIFYKMRQKKSSRLDLVPLLSKIKVLRKRAANFGQIPVLSFAFYFFICVLLRTSVVNENKVKSEEQKGQTFSKAEYELARRAHKRQSSVLSHVLFQGSANYETMC